jgi:hypothetical protein
LLGADIAIVGVPVVPPPPQSGEVGSQGSLPPQDVNPTNRRVANNDWGLLIWTTVDLKQEGNRGCRPQRHSICPILTQAIKRRKSPERAARSDNQQHYDFRRSIPPFCAPARFLRTHRPWRWPA